MRVSKVHLPALNTPQFDWVRSRLPRRPQPVPPIFQPEVAADAIHWVAQNPTTELWVGQLTRRAIVGQRIAPRLLDRYAARTAWDAQQTHEPADPHRPDNLWQPLDGDRSARGSFDDRARPRSLQLEASKRRRGLALAAAVAAAAGAGVTYLARR